MNHTIKEINEPIKSYAPLSKEKKLLQEKYDQMASEVIDIPIIIGGNEIKTKDTDTCVMPHDHQHILANYYMAGENVDSDTPATGRFRRGDIWYKSRDVSTSAVQMPGQFVESYFLNDFMSTNHNDIGILYIVTAALFGFISVAFTVYMRLELMEPGVQYMTTDGQPNGHLWNVLITGHGILMMFFVLTSYQL